MSVKGAAESRPYISEKGEATSSQKETISCVQEVYNKAADLLLLVWFALQYVFHALSKVEESKWQKVFDGKILCTTSNHAKFSDLPDYVTLKRSPIEVSQTHLKALSTLGLTPRQTSLAPTPFSKGHCFGNTIAFLKKWKETHDIDEILPLFEGGSPLVGSAYQEMYSELYESIYYPVLCERIVQVISSYPLVSFAEEARRWKELHLGDALFLLDGLQAYLKEKRHPKKGGFVEAITRWTEAKRNIRVGGKFLETLRQVQMHYIDDNLSKKAHMQAAFAFGGLKVKKFHAVDCPPEELLNSFSCLDSGLYQLAFPTYSPLGKPSSPHSVGIIVDADTCYFLESNGAVAWCEQSELTQTVGRLFSFYTGLDYSEDLKGTVPSVWKKIDNFFSESSNPPLTPLTKGFDLIEVE